MRDPQPLKPGDQCPNCGAGFDYAPEPTDAQRAAAANREDPMPLPPRCDSASREFRAEHGALARCVRCPYTTRFPLDAKKPAPQQAT